MATFVFTNNFLTTLAANFNNTATTMTLSTTTNLPASIPAGSFFPVTLNDAATGQVYEICYATALSGANLTVVRAQEGTTAQNWLSGDRVYADVTAGVLAGLFQQTGIKTGLVTNVSVGVVKPVTLSPAFTTSITGLSCTVSTAANDLGAYSCHTDSETRNGFNLTVTGGGAATVNVWYIAFGN